MALDAHIKTIGFDMDGTVMNTIVDYEKLATIVMDEYVDLGVPADVIAKDAEHNSMDHGLAWLKENNPRGLIGLDKRIGDRATAIEMEHADEAAPYPGVRELLERLIEKGYRVALLTRGGRRYALSILEKEGLLRYFENLVARDDFPYSEAKPNPVSIDHMIEGLGCTREEVLYVGDGSVDWKTAENAKCQFIGVETHSDRAGWEALAGPSVRTVGSVGDLIHLI